jgi:hypothetical protein
MRTDCTVLVINFEPTFFECSNHRLNPRVIHKVLPALKAALRHGGMDHRPCAPNDLDCR